LFSENKEIDMKARDIMTAQPACCGPTDRVQRAAQLMEQNDCGCIPVVTDDNSVIGVITDRDIAIRGVAHGHRSDSRVDELMTPSPYCCSVDADLRAVEDVMSDRQVRRVVIVDDDNCCVGIIAQADLARAAHRTDEVSDAEVGRVVENVSEPGPERR
jgi:CBS domain-containing protein